MGIEVSMVVAGLISLWQPPCLPVTSRWVTASCEPALPLTAQTYSPTSVTCTCWIIRRSDLLSQRPLILHHSSSWYCSTTPPRLGEEHSGVSLSFSFLYQIKPVLEGRLCVNWQDRVTCSPTHTTEGSTLMVIGTSPARKRWDQMYCCCCCFLQIYSFY